MQVAAEPLDDRRKWLTLGVMCIALFMVMLDNTVVNVALPSIQRDLGSSIAGLEWIVNGYTLSFAVLLATGGRMGDIFGRRRMFIFGVVVFTLSSFTAGFAPDQSALVISRIAQGVGAAFMMPGTLSIITDAFPAEERGKAIGTWAGVSALALAVGPVLGGYLTEDVSWRMIFYINLPVGLLAVVAAVFYVRESRDTSVGREVDYPGVAVMTVGLTAIVLALIEGNTWGWTSPAVLGLIALSLVALPVFVMVENRSKAPIVEFPLFRSRNFIGAVTVAFIISFAMLGVFFFLALYMQNILGYSALEAGVRFLPTTLVIMVVAPIAGRLADRLGPRWPIVAGMSLLTASLWWFSTIDIGTTFSDLLPAFLLLGVGIAMTMSPMSMAAMNAVVTNKAGLASGLLSMFRMIGGTFGVALLGALFQWQARHRFKELAADSIPGVDAGEIARELTGGVPQGISGLSPEQAEQLALAARESFVYGLSHAMVLSVVVAVIGVAVALFLIGDRSRTAGATEEVELEAENAPPSVA